MKFNNLILIIVFLVVVFVSGLLGGILMFSMGMLQTTLESVDFTFPDAQEGEQLQTLQGVLSVTTYPILGLRSAIPNLTYFLIFGLIIALAITGYVSSKNPVFFIVHILFTLLITYFSMVLANQYEIMLSQPFINTMMIDFPIYNRIMLSLPYILFFTSLLFGVISFSLVMKPGSQGSPYGLNYGGEY